MKKGIHPENYRLVAFKDMSNGVTTITKSTAATKETIEIDGVEYPLVKLEISNTSHPFYTGKVKLVDTAGRVDKFMNRYKDHFENPMNQHTTPLPNERRFCFRSQETNSWHRICVI